MSRSKPNSGAVSPVEQYFQWSGSEGKIVYYDKGKGSNEYIPKMSFIVLDELHTITGYSDKEKNGIRGTDVKSLDTPITMYIGKKKITTNTYENLKGIAGVRYGKSLYIGLITKNGLKICKLILSGAGFGAWLDFIKGENDYKESGSVNPLESGVGIRITGKSKPKKKGSNTYFEPVFQKIEVKPEQEEEAMTLDALLQEYFESKSKSTSSDEQEVTKKEKKQNVSKDDDDDDEDMPDDDDDEEIDDANDVDDLPF